MTDRTPTKVLENGAVRYGVYDEGGALLRYEYIRPEDEPTSEGTPLNASTLLKPATAEKLGLAASALPDDALRALCEGKADLDPETGLVRSAQLPGLDYVPLAQKGAAEGVAELDASGAVPAGQLPPLVASFHGRTGAVAPQAGDYTPAQVGAAAQAHTHAPADLTGLSGTDYGTSRVRGISAGTADLTAGTSNLESGAIYLVYE